MNKQYITTILAVTSLAFSAGAMAQSMSESEYKSAEKSINAECKSDKMDCDSFADNAKDICMAVAKGKEKVAKAELEARYKPSKNSGYDISIAKAEADYEVAKERCDDKAGNAEDICVQEAKAAFVHAKADAKAQLKTSKPMIIANEEPSASRAKSKESGGKTHQSAAAYKHDADYAVAKEKCNAMSGDAKDVCVNKAGKHYGK
ncbi:MAG: hypothetical protein PHP70_07840 [Gallionella sp.]|nr:hypothetical protein [Gallionella sp.]